VVLILSPLRWIESLLFGRKIRNFKFKNPPIFILGHWRSGTTLLFQQLCQDPQFGFVDTFQSFFPHHVLMSEGFLRPLAALLLPDKRPTDNVKLSFSFPQEDEFALGNMNPHSFYHAWYFPENTRFVVDNYFHLDNLSPKDREKWKKDYKTLLAKALINTGKDQIVVKNPVNTGRIRILLEMFPDAKFIYIHRNPFHVFKSTRKLYAKTLPMLCMQEFYEEEVRDNILHIYQKMFEWYEDEKDLIPSANLVEVKFEDLEADLVGNMGQLYERLSLPGYEKALPYFEAYASKLQGYKKNVHRFSEEEVRLVVENWQESLAKWKYEVPGAVGVK
jgi:hypothetical protein